MKRFMTLLAWMAACHSLSISCRAYKLETGVPYFVRLRQDRKCVDNNNLLSFYNRTCGSLPPMEVGPSLRSASGQSTWSQWVFTITGESDGQQWGYMETYYPEERGKARCVGPLNAINNEECRGEGSESATIDPQLETSLFRFVPLSREEGTYRIILKDRPGKNCNRFLSAAQDCSINTVFFVPSDLGGLQRWVITKVNPTDPSPPPPTESPPPPPTSTPSPTPSPIVIPPPTLAVSEVSFTRVNLSVLFAEGYSVRSCSVRMSPGGHSETVSMPEGSSTSFAVFSGLAPKTTYIVTALCILDDGTESSESDFSFTTLGQLYNPPTEGQNVCDGLGEILSSGSCVCDTQRGFVPRSEGGCICDPAEGLVHDGQGGCESPRPQCDISAGYEDDGQGGCKPTVKFYLAENGITIKCPEADDNEQGELNGVMYTKRTNKDDIDQLNAPTTCTTGCTDMSGLFEEFPTFIANISHWDTSSVTDMQRMFKKALNFNKDISAWNTSSVTDMESMFELAINFNQDLSGWDVSSLSSCGKPSAFDTSAGFAGQTAKQPQWGCCDC